MDDHEHDGGLAHDLATLARRATIAVPPPPPPPMARRRALALMGGAGLGLALAACGGSSGTTAASTTSTSTTAAAAGGVIPEETAGPYPGDGSNGPDVLVESGVVRRDITTSFGSLSGTAEGVPLSVTMTLPAAGLAVYLWHCDRDGGYSLYSPGVEDQNYLRGVQEADADGAVTFDTIFPAAYDGRWPHIHFEVYESLAEATRSGAIAATSQLALPEAACAEVYATDGYERSVQNMARTSLESDMVFSDGVDLQLATVTGSVSSGYSATLAVELG